MQVSFREELPLSRFIERNIFSSISITRQLIQLISINYRKPNLASGLWRG